MIRYVCSPTIFSIAVYGVSGLAFVGANLLLARALPTEEYALLTLVVALVTLGYHLAPLGLDGVVMRGRVDVALPLLRRVVAVAALVGIAFMLTAIGVYGVQAPIAAWLLPACVAGALLLVGAARFQREQRFALSLVLVMSPNALLPVGAAATLVLGLQTAALTVAVLTVGLAAAASIAWTTALREHRRSPRPPPWRVPWNEAAALAGMSTAAMLFVQLERLVIPHALGTTDLARFGVLAAIAGSLFRVLQMGVGYTLLPRLRRAASVFERRRLIAHEARFAIVVVTAGAGAILLVTPLVERWFLGGKYHLATGLVVAAVVSGVVKIVHAFARAAATALATPRELALVNGAGWASVALAIGCAFLAAPWGLAGVIYGVSAGWLAWAAMALLLVARHLRMPAGVPAET